MADNKINSLKLRYNLEVEDLYSIRYSNETIERLAIFYGLQESEIKHIKETDILDEVENAGR